MGRKKDKKDVSGWEDEENRGRLGKARRRQDDEEMIALMGESLNINSEKKDVELRDANRQESGDKEALTHDTDEKGNEEVLPHDTDDNVPRRRIIEMKLAVVVRKDLGMTAGKMAAQCCHAALSAVSEVKSRDPQMLRDWKRQGAPIIILRTNNLASLREVHEKAKDKNVAASTVCDAGRTEVEGGTVTCLGIGPAASEKCDQVTRRCRLF